MTLYGTEAMSPGPRDAPRTIVRSMRHAPVWSATLACALILQCTSSTQSVSVSAHVPQPQQHSHSHHHRSSDEGPLHGIAARATSVQTAFVNISTTSAMRDASGQPIYDCLEPHISQFNGTYYAYGFTVREEPWQFAGTCYSSRDLKQWTLRARCLIAPCVRIALCLICNTRSCMTTRSCRVFFYLCGCRADSLRASSGQMWSPRDVVSCAVVVVWVAAPDFGHL
jgi:hypothetical protein